MTVLISWTHHYLSQLSKSLVFGIILLMAILVAVNYNYGIEYHIRQLKTPTLTILAFFLLYLSILAASFGLHFISSGYYLREKSKFWILLLIAPLLFAIKTGINSSNWTNWFFGTINKSSFLVSCLHWPCMTIFTLTAVFIVSRLLHLQKLQLGLSFKKTNYSTYVLLVAFMLPFLFMAALQHDFQSMYPKYQHALYPPQGIFELAVYEFCYGTDFFTIELFFRGFLVLAFIQLIGKEAILPVAAFYCSIHFGKPLFECISSFFGGVLLGIVVYRSGTIWSGLIVHLGIAWLMEAAGITMKYIFG